MPIITEVRGRSEPDIPHLPRPECLVEDRINRSIDDTDDAEESKTIEEYDDGCLHYCHEAEPVDPSCGDWEGVSPCTDIHGDGSLEEVGSDDDDSRSEAMLSHDRFGRHFHWDPQGCWLRFYTGHCRGQWPEPYYDTFQARI